MMKFSDLNDDDRSNPIQMDFSNVKVYDVRLKHQKCHQLMNRTGKTKLNVIDFNASDFRGYENGITK